MKPAESMNQFLPYANTKQVIDPQEHLLEGGGEMPSRTIEGSKREHEQNYIFSLLQERGEIRKIHANH